MTNQAPPTRIAKGVLTPADRVKTIVHRGKKLLQIDFSNCALSEVMQVIDLARKQIDSCPPKSLLIFTDLTNTAAEPPVVQALRDFAKSNAPNAKASATVGLSGPKSLILSAINKFSGREILHFDDPSAAKTWLTNH
jgi:hypothetical protein